MKGAIVAGGLEHSIADITMQASTTVDLELDDAQKVMRLVDTLEDLDDQTDEGYALLEEFNNKVSERGGEYQKYIKAIDVPDTFNLHLDITKVRGLEADYQWSEDDFADFQM